MPTKDEIHREYGDSASSRGERVARDVRIYARHPACTGLALDRSLTLAIHQSWRTELAEDMVTSYREYVDQVCGPIGAFANELSAEILEEVRRLRRDLTTDDVKGVYRDRARTAVNGRVGSVLTEGPHLAVDVFELRAAVIGDGGFEDLADTVAGRARNEERPLPEMTAADLALVDALLAEAVDRRSWLLARVRSLPGTVSDADAVEIVDDTLRAYWLSLRGGCFRAPDFDCGLGAPGPDRRWAQANYVMRALKNRYNSHLASALGRHEQEDELDPRGPGEEPTGRPVPDVVDGRRDATEIADTVLGIRAAMVAGAARADVLAEGGSGRRGAMAAACARYLRGQAGMPEDTHLGRFRPREERRHLQADLLSCLAEVAPHLVPAEGNDAARSRVTSDLVAVLREMLAGLADGLGAS